MNRGALKLFVSRTLGISLGTSDDAIEEDTLLNDLANLAVLDILARTRIHVRHATAVLATGETEFDIDPIVLKVYRIFRGDVLLEELDLDALDSSGYAFLSEIRIKFGLAGAGDNVTIWYTPLPTAMTDDAHDPATQAYGNIPAAHHLAILNFMLWHAADKSGDQGSARGERYRLMYEGQDGLAGPGTDLGRIKTAINMRGGATTVRRPRQVLTSDLDPSYWTG
jgi:hypothetical protein